MHFFSKEIRFVWIVPVLVWTLAHLAVEQGVVVPPHLWINVLQVPLKAFTLQTLPQRHPLGDVAVIDAVVLPEQG